MPLAVLWHHWHLLTSSNCQSVSRFALLVYDNKYSKTCLMRPLKKNTKIVFQDRLSLHTGQKYCKMLQESILQYFRPSLNYHLSLRHLFVYFERSFKTGFTVYECE